VFFSQSHLVINGPMNQRHVLERIGFNLWGEGRKKGPVTLSTTATELGGGLRASAPATPGKEAAAAPPETAREGTEAIGGAGVKGQEASGGASAAAGERRGFHEPVSLWREVRTEQMG
jgi:hypothetical protein